MLKNLVLAALLALPPALGSGAARAADAQPPEDSELIVAELKGLVIVGSVDAVVKQGLVGVRGVKVYGVQILDQDDFKREIAKHLGKPLTKRSRVQILDDIALYCRRHGRGFVDVSTLPQDVTEGVLQVLVLEAKVGELRVLGNRWFKTEHLARQMRSKPGEPLDTSVIAQDLDWLNRNPFRQVDLVYVKGSEFGTANLLLREIDRFPLRVFAGYDDSGTRLTQNDRLSAGVNWGNVFGGDGQLDYQFLVSPNLKSLKAHSASFTQPLPWRHALTVFGSYATIQALLPAPFDLAGYNWQTSARYEVPLPGGPAYRHSLNAGFDLKRSNNNLTFGGVSVFTAATDVAQWSLGYNARLRDAWGESTLRGTLFLSPGGMTLQNSDAAFQMSRVAARAHYVYGKVEVNRTTGLPLDFTLVNLLTLQRSNSNLLASEQLGFGGHDTIRGYDTRVFNSDSGYIVTTELRTPSMPAASYFRRFEPLQDKWQLLAFLDYGAGGNHIRLAGEPGQTRLMSAGPGLRYAIATNVSLRADYGFQLLNEAEAARPYASRSHLGLVVRY